MFLGLFPHSVDKSLVIASEPLAALPIGGTSLAADETKVLGVNLEPPCLGDLESEKVSSSRLISVLRPSTSDEICSLVPEISISRSPFLIFTRSDKDHNTGDCVGVIKIPTVVKRSLCSHLLG